MKVFLLTTGSYPKGMASVARLKCYIYAIQRGGCECELDVFERSYLYGKDSYSHHVRISPDGIHYWYAGGRLYGCRNKLLRFFYKRFDKLRMISHLRSNVKKGDMVLTYFSDVDFTHKVINTVHKQGGFVIKELNEIPGKGNNTSAAQKLKYRTEKELFPQFDGVICISEALQEYVAQFTSLKCNIIKVPILVDFKEFDLVDRQKESEMKYVFHAGSLHEQKDGILGMIEAFAKATNKLGKTIHFVLTGVIEKSPHCDKIKKIINQYRIEQNIHFTGYLSKDELRETLSKASLVIINKYPTEQNKYCFSTKLGEYMAAGKPIVITNVGEAKNWLQEGETAYFVEPHDIDQLSNAIIKVFNNPEKSIEIAQRGKALCRKNFDCMSYADILNQYFNDINNG